MSNNVIHRFVMSISSSRHGGCLAGAMGDHQNSSADSPRALMVYFVMQNLNWHQSIYMPSPEWWLTTTQPKIATFCN
jgi:hypothetical protein